MLTQQGDFGRMKNSGLVDSDRQLNACRLNAKAAILIARDFPGPANSSYVNSSYVVRDTGVTALLPNPLLPNQAASVLPEPSFASRLETWKMPLH